VQPTIDQVTSPEDSALDSSKAQQTVVAAAAAQRDSWRSGRLSSLTSAQGNLALIQTRWLPAGETVSDEDALAGQPDTVIVTRLQRTSLESGADEFGVRLWDSISPAIVNFETVSVFDFATEWVIEAEFTPVANDRAIPFEHIRDNGSSRDLIVPGDITFTLDEVDYRLSAFDDGGTLLLVFGDLTNGRDGANGTYESGRFLFVERPGSGTQFNAAGTVVLDFNKAFVPPCGFSNEYNCPLPPRNNRFAREVTAGEKRVVFTGGFQLH
jgi:uncharacterized protein